MHLRPLRIGEILDGAVRLYRDNFVPFVLMTAAVYLPFYVLVYLLVGTLSPRVNLPEIASQAGGLSSLLFFFTAYPLGSGMLAYAASEHVLGRTVRVGDALRRMLGHATTLLAVVFLLVLSVSAILGTTVLLFVAPMAAGALVPGFLPGAVAIAALAAAAALVAIVLIYVRWQLFPQAVVVERLGAVASLQRSWRLTAGFGWKAFAILLLLSLLISVVQVAAVAVGTLALRFAAVGVRTEDVAGAGQLLYALIGVVLEPMRMAGMTLLYYDLRVRKEGLDLQILARDLRRGAPEVAG
ncbi:MAG: hypothetical protein QN163_04830 [Armatimonadota bacterium]|nr:hypothetical protein [Armatimonadota bacterium]MDR5696108.1 hypothetical protein [Armatimonadota bacterium]